MSRRAIVTGSVTAIVAMSVLSAAAAPAKACNLVQDGRDDATRTYVSGVNGTNSPALDIVSADVASNKKDLTTVVRVAKYSATDTMSPYGMAWRVTFKVGEFELYTKAMLDRAGASTYEYGVMENGGESKLGATGGKVVIDAALNEIRVTAPVLGFVTKAAPSAGKRSGALTAKSFRGLPRPALDSDADAADSTASYTFGSPSCVVVGR